MLENRKKAFNVPMLKDKSIAKGTTYPIWWNALTKVTVLTHITSLSKFSFRISTKLQPPKASRVDNA